MFEVRKGVYMQCSVCYNSDSSVRTLFALHENSLVGNSIMLCKKCRQELVSCLVDYDKEPVQEAAFTDYNEQTYFQRYKALKRKIKDAAERNQYKNPEDRESYSQYNEGWQDAIDFIAGEEYENEEDDE